MRQNDSLIDNEWSSVKKNELTISKETTKCSQHIPIYTVKIIFNLKYISVSKTLYGNI